MTKNPLPSVPRLVLSLLSILTIAAAGLVLSGCQSQPPDDVAVIAKESAVAADDGAAEPVPVANPGVVDVRAEEYAFYGPPTLPSGWVTLRFHNDGAEPHFLLLWNLPEGKTFEDYDNDVGQPFESLYVRYRAGEIDKATFFEKLIAAIPPWFYEAVPMGGPGFTAPGATSEVTVYLEPGDNYVMECYVRAQIQPDSFHGTHGMFRPLIVTDEVSPVVAPEPDVHVTLSSFELAVEGELGAGSHLARVAVEDTPEGFVRHNVHLVRLEKGQSGATVAAWMDWVDAMLPPAPAEFLGGAGQTVEGRVSYVPFSLEPGRYAWVSEGFAAKDMVHEFTVE